MYAHSHTTKLYYSIFTHLTVSRDFFGGHLPASIDMCADLVAIA